MLSNRQFFPITNCVEKAFFSTIWIEISTLVVKPRLELRMYFASFSASGLVFMNAQSLKLIYLCSLYINLILIASVLNGCTGNGTLSTSLNASNDSTVTANVALPGGARSIKILFKQSTAGSFDAPPSSGTLPQVGQGLKASRLFNLDGSILASAVLNTTTGKINQSANWPAWFKSLEIGVSGSLNTAAPNPDCARFADSSESTLSNCFIGPGPTPNTLPNPSACGAPAGQFRVSEADCAIANGSIQAATTGSGGANDGIYFRAVFDRTNLGSTENLLVVLEYASSSLNSAPSNPSLCFTNGSFTPEKCSDFVWRTYLKRSESEVVQPYLLLVPPTFSAVLGSNGILPNSGAGLATKQIFIPLASNAAYSVFQISRTQANFPSIQNLLNYCTAAAALPGRSPLCAGMVFYSLTLIRI